MTADHALFVKLQMTKSACDKWLKSPIRYVSDYVDWAQMNPTVARNCDEWLETFPRPEFMSVEEYLEGMAELSQHFCFEYDENLGAFFAADVRRSAAAPEIATCVAALRGAQDFVNDGMPGFLFVFPVTSGGDPIALLKIERGGAAFLPSSTDAPDALYFIEEAEDFIEALLDDDAE